jgi:TonB family protein
MKRLIGATAALALLTGVAFGQKSDQKSLLRLEPAEVLWAANTYYPPLSVAFGTVVLQVTIGESSEIEAIKVIRDIPSLTEEAIRSVKKWKFKPATLNGRPVRSAVPVAFTFTRRQLFPIPKQP